MKRKCAYTNKEATVKDSILPREILGKEQKNWAVEVPCNEDYLLQKQGRLPTELEMQAHEVFHLLELARLRVRYFEAKLEAIQLELGKDFQEKPKAEISVKKALEIQKAVVEKEVIGEKSATAVDDYFENKRKIWDTDE